MCAPYNFSCMYQTCTYKLIGGDGIVLIGIVERRNGVNKHVVTILRGGGVGFRLDSCNIEFFER
jgi:hypothetical protein